MTYTTRVLAALALACSAGAHAQALEDRTDHQRFACLQRERALEALPGKRPENRNNGVLRFKLRFVAPDQPPRIEKLNDSYGDADMERIARRYLAGYRLPCLHAEEHPVDVVQEFSFSRWGVEQPVLLPGARPPLKVKFPDQDLQPPAWTDPTLGKALVEITFLEGKEEPEMRFVFSALDPHMQRRIQDHVRGYRLLDGGGRGFPIKVTQLFAVVDPKHGATQYRLNKDRYTLLEFLRLVGNLREHPIDLDLDSMACPFAVRVRLQQPYETNDVVQIDTRDANRAYLLDWLGKLKPRWANEAQQMDLHGTDMLVQVPCGRLNLLDIARPAAPAAQASQAGG